MTTNFPFALKWMLYFVRFNAETNVAEITLWTQEKITVDLKDKKYCIASSNIGIDEKGVFGLDPESAEIILRCNPFIPLFRKGQRRCFQCEYDEFCFNNSKTDDYFKENAPGNIIIWEEICKKLNK